MFKKKLVALSAIMIAGLMTFQANVSADAVEEKPYLSLGADLSASQKSKVLELLGVKENELDQYKVVKVTDYKKPEETGLPAANVLIYKLENNETVIVRPSGTEPKIKIYYTTLGKDLAEAQAEKDKLSEALKPIMK